MTRYEKGAGIILVGNKTDLQAPVVTHAEAQALATRIGASYLEISAKEKKGFDALLDTITTTRFKPKAKKRWSFMGLFNKSPSAEQEAPHIASTTTNTTPINTTASNTTTTTTVTKSDSMPTQQVEQADTAKEVTIQVPQVPEATIVQKVACNALYEFENRKHRVELQNMAGELQLVETLFQMCNISKEEATQYYVEYFDTAFNEWVVLEQLKHVPSKYPKFRIVKLPNCEK